MNIRRSWTGLVFISVYAALAIPLLIYAYFIVEDFKGAYVFKQVAVAPALFAMGRLFSIFDLTPKFLNNIPAFLFLSLVIVYAVGWLAEASGTFVFSRVYAGLTTKRVRRPMSVRGRISRYALATAFFFGLD